MANFKSSKIRRRRSPRISDGRILALAKDLSMRGKGRVDLGVLGREDWSRLATTLGHDDPQLRRAAGSLFVARGEAGWPLLLDALRRGTAPARRSAIHVVGKVKLSSRREGERRRLLLDGLRDEDDKVRKNAAVALGSLEATTEEGPLADEIARGLVAAHGREERSWVRASVVLALGRSPSEVARSHLEGFVGRDDDEMEALRTVRRSGSLQEALVHVPLTWTGPLPVEIRGHGGLGDELHRRIRQLGLRLREEPRGERFLAEVVDGPDRLWELRSMREWRILLGRIERRAEGKLAEVLARALDGGRALRDLAGRLGLLDGTTGFRVSEEGKAGRSPRRTWVRPFASWVEETLPTWVNAPGDYSVEICVGFGRDVIRIWLRPGRVHDPRFRHRAEALPASLQPSVAAGLVGLLEPRPTWNVLDPCCGAGTLLAEMAAAGVTGRLTGVDRSSDAIARARRNFGRSPWSANFVEGDLGRVRLPGTFDAVVANLPFGIRVSEHGANEKLYREALRSRLREPGSVPGGRAMVLSQEIELLEKHAPRNRCSVHVLEATDRRRIAMGGLEPHGPRPSPSVLTASRRFGRRPRPAFRGPDGARAWNSVESTGRSAVLGGFGGELLEMGQEELPGEDLGDGHEGNGHEESEEAEELAGDEQG